MVGEPAPEPPAEPSEMPELPAPFAWFESRRELPPMSPLLPADARRWQKGLRQQGQPLPVAGPRWRGEATKGAPALPHLAPPSLHG